jgi:hypothetical protein
MHKKHISFILSVLERGIEAVQGFQRGGDVSAFSSRLLMIASHSGSSFLRTEYREDRRLPTLPIIPPQKRSPPDTIGRSHLRERNGRRTGFWREKNCRRPLVAERPYGPPSKQSFLFLCSVSRSFSHIKRGGTRPIKSKEGSRSLAIELRLTVRSLPNFF